MKKEINYKIYEVFIKDYRVYTSDTTTTKISKYKKDKIKTKGIIQWFFYREFKQLTKTSAFFFNTIFGNLMIVVMYLGMMFMAYINGGDSIVGISGFIVGLQKNTSTALPTTFLICIAIGTFFSMFSTGAATTYSREKNDLEMLKSMPIDMKRAFLGKVLFHYLIGFSTTFVFMLVPMIFLKIRFIYILTMTISVLLVNIALIWLPIISDLQFPNLSWESETAVAKRAKSIWISMLLSLFMDLVIIGSGVLMLFTLGIDTKIVSSIIFVFLLVLSFMLYKVYQKLIDKRFSMPTT